MTRHGRFRLQILLALLFPAGAFGQAGYNDNRVMIQGFERESCIEGKVNVEGQDVEAHNKEKWYKLVTEKAKELADAEFDLIWLPPPSDCGDDLGYIPRRLYDFDNAYGSLDEHRACVHKLLELGVEPIADVVINHRAGTTGWADFTEPAWPSTYVCSDDEFWDQPSGALNAADQQLKAANKRGSPDFTFSDYTRVNYARDLDHSNAEFRAAVKEYLGKLKAFGYRGWRYDLVKGYDANRVAEYDFGSDPTFAVGEYMDNRPELVSAWIDGTKLQGQPDPALRACSAFDFPTQALLSRFLAAGQYDRLRAISFKDNVDDGLIAINKDKAVTFVENHDTGFPKNRFDTFPDDAKLMRAYAFILTHPGVPCVYWKHYFDWNHGAEIRKLVKARKYAGVNSGSFIKTEVQDGDYVAVVGDQPGESSTLIVKIGPGTAFHPDAAEWTLETSGDGYAVWVRTSKKNETKAQVDAEKEALPVPPG